jgi:hypothetical protein
MLVQIPGPVKFSSSMIPSILNEKKGVGHGSLEVNQILGSVEGRGKTKAQMQRKQKEQESFRN